MGLKRIEQVKGRKPFSIWDVLVYALLLGVVLFLLLFFLLGKSEGIEGIRIFVQDELACSYSFGEGLQVEDTFFDKVNIREEGDFVYLTVGSEEGYNVVQIDCKARVAQVIDADCSFHKDCTYMKEISSEDGAIICVPHGVKVVALGGEEGVGAPVLG